MGFAALYSSYGSGELGRDRRRHRHGEFQQLLARADRALYAAKDAGKGRVALAGAMPQSAPLDAG